MNRARFLAAIVAGLSLSCTHQEALDPLAFGRPTSFDASCPGAEVAAKADVATMAPATEVMRSRNGWTVTTAGGTWRFGGLDESSEPVSDASLGPFCQRAARANRATVARDVDGICVLGVDRGEWGGWMETIAPGPPPTRVAILRDNPRWMRPAGADGRSLLVMSGIGHMSVTLGAFYRLDRSAQGTWCRGPTVDLEGDPMAWRADGPGRFAILVFAARPSSDAGAPQPGPTGPFSDAGAPPASPTAREEGGPHWYYVVRVDDEGRLLPVEPASVSIE